jgi:queuosine precursor transporter
MSDAPPPEPVDTMQPVAPAWAPTRRDLVLLVLTGVFLTHAIVGEIAGGKLISWGGWVMSVGVLPWPFVFVTTDLVNEYYGPRAVRRLTLLAIVLIAYAFVVIFACVAVPTADISPVDHESFAKVFGQSMWIIVGSVVAFGTSQLLDAFVFTMLRNRTAGKMLWIRAVGSTVVSQLVDSFVVTWIGFGWRPGGLVFAEVLEVSIANYTYKFVIAIATLPLIYLGHNVVDRYLARDR